VRLHEFLTRFGALDDAAFDKTFNHPFLLQEGKLKVEGGGDAGERQVYLLRPPPSGALLVGRSQSAEVSVPDKQVSSKHAEIKELAGGRWQLLDLGSTNGTFVDGKQCAPNTPVPVADAMSVRFGPDAAFMFLAAKSFLPIFRRLQEKLAPDAANDPASATVLDAQTEHGLQVRDLREKLKAEAETSLKQGPDLFLCCDGMDAVRVEKNKPVIVGRSPGHATMVLPHGEVSRAHAEIVRNDRGVTIRDLGSANGTFVCNVKINQSPVELPIGKAVTIGPFTLILQGPPSEAGLTIQVNPGTALRGTTGDLGKTPIADVLQEIEAEQKTGVLEAFGPGCVGRVSFRGGKPCNAKTDDGKIGVEAIQALLAMKQGTFTLKNDASAVGPGRIEKAFSDILLEDFLG
jgi:pSer/pThr/pTyr-binding forkhead associated (FHA) protein